MTANAQPDAKVAPRMQAAARARLTPKVVAAIIAWWFTYSVLYGWNTWLLAQRSGQDLGWAYCLHFGLGTGLPWILPTLFLGWLVLAHPLQRGPVVRGLALYVLAALFALLLRLLAREAFYALFPLQGRQQLRLPHDYLLQIAQNLPWVLMIVLAAYAWRYFKRTQAQSLRISQVEAHLANARLDALRARLNPHFLFNALNSVGEQMHRDVASADRMLVSLSGLLRDRLGTDERQLRTLDEELTLVRDYLMIEQLRLGERLQVAWEIEDAALALPVPALSVQVLVENAIVHAIARSRQTGRLVVGARVHDSDVLEIEIGNSMAAGIESTPGAGTGLANVAERLRLLYGDAARIERSQTPGAWHHVRLTLPLRAGEGAPAWN